MVYLRISCAPATAIGGYYEYFYTFIQSRIINERLSVLIILYFIDNIDFSWVIIAYNGGVMLVITVRFCAISRIPLGKLCPFLINLCFFI